MAAAAAPDGVTEQLRKADGLRTGDYAQFNSLLESIARQKSLTPAQRDYLSYLQAWKSVYEGQYELAISRLQATIRETHDVTLKFRAKASIINALIVSSHYEEAFTELTQLLVLLPKVTDPAAREQGLIVKIGRAHV